MRGLDSTNGDIASPKSLRLEWRIGSQLRSVFESLFLSSTLVRTLSAAMIYSLNDSPR